METVSDISQLPALEAGVVHVWGVHVPDMVGCLDALRAVLSPEERARAERFRRPADRASSVVARGALRGLLGGYAGLSATEVRFDYSANGKPRLASGGAGIDFNLSHSGDWVVLAFGRNRRIGVDLERIKPDLDVASIAARFLAPEEASFLERADDPQAAFFHIWARKEAYVKACGSSILRELSRFCVPLAEDRLPERAEKDGWIFQRIEAGSSYAAALATDRALEAVACYDFGGLQWGS